MKTHSIIAIAYILISCSVFRNERSISTYHSPSQNGKDTVQLLDTLVLDFFNKNYVTNYFSVKTESNELIFKQTIFNSTLDTLELQAKASAGWVAPKFSRTVLPKSCSVIIYSYLVTNHKGYVNTTITLEYKNLSNIEVNNNYIPIILRGWIE
jgi:hypothetical protein